MKTGKRRRNVPRSLYERVVNNAARTQAPIDLDAAGREVRGWSRSGPPEGLLLTHRKATFHDRPTVNSRGSHLVTVWVCQCPGTPANVESTETAAAGALLS